MGTVATPHGTDARRMGAWAQDLTGISTKTIAASTSTTTAGAGAALALLLANALHEGSARTVVGRLLVAGLLLRVALAIFIGARGGFPDEYGTYHPLAAEAASCWAAGGPSSVADHPVVEGRSLYFNLLSGAYFAAGAWMAVGRALGIAIGLLAAVMAGEAARALGGKRAALIGVGVLALHPRDGARSGGKVKPGRSRASDSSPMHTYLTPAHLLDPCTLTSSIGF